MARALNLAWAPPAGPIRLRPAASKLAAVQPLLERIVEALGANKTADILDVDRSQVSRWMGGAQLPGAEMSRRIVDLHDVLTRILRVYEREAAELWLTGSEPLLGGARPLDVLALEGAAPVIRAIDGIMQGVYA